MVSKVQQFPFGAVTVASVAAVNPFKVARIPINFADGPTNNDTGFELPAESILLPWVYVRVLTPEVTGVTKTIRVGSASAFTGGDQNSFIGVPGVSVASVGLVGAKSLITNTANNVFFSSTSYGRDFAQNGDGHLIVGDDVVNGGDGDLVITPFKQSAPIAQPTTITWLPGSADFAEFVGEIILLFVDLGVV